MSTLLVLIVASASFYAAATVLMKYWSSFPPAAMVLLIVAAFAVGAWCEVEALRGERLAVVYVAILGTECMIVAGISYFALGEALSLREVSGGLLVLGGLALAGS